jgi:hypothetical protein
LVRDPKKPRDASGPGIYKEALTNFKVSIFRETYLEESVTEEDRDSILELLGVALRRTPLGELPRLRSYRLEGGALIYTCADPQSGQWLIEAIGNRELGSGGRLKATEAKNLPKPVKVALRLRENIATTPEELLAWIKQLNPGLHTEYWRVLDRARDQRAQAHLSDRPGLL